jgi:uncharacterized protein (TIGR00725 family)
VIGVVGASTAEPDLDSLAYEVGRLLAEAGCAIVCGGLGGVMAAACRGAKSASGLTIGILPGPLRSDANPFVDVAIATGMGEARNVVIVRASASSRSTPGRSPGRGGMPASCAPRIPRRLSECS